jgi:large subunit ribosomal protein L30e
MAKPKRSAIELSALNRELQKVLNNGNMLIGSKETMKAFMRNEARIIIHASNCPGEIKKIFEETFKKENGELTVYEYPANSLELGLACGKPYPVASLCITDTDNSEIVRLLTPNAHSTEKALNINMREKHR